MKYKKEYIKNLDIKCKNYNICKNNYVLCIAVNSHKAFDFDRCGPCVIKDWELEIKHKKNECLKYFREEGYDLTLEV